MKVRESLLIILFLFLCTALNAKPKRINDLTPADAGKKPTDRPSVALVLSGGGAKGFAELPVMEYIEQMDIPIDMIIGTSVGAIIGGFYSAGYSAQGVIDEFSKVEWSRIFDDKTASPYEDIYGIHGENVTPLSIGFGTNFSLKLSSGFSKGQYALSLLRSLLLKIPSDINFNDLNIPFRAVSTDMNSGDAYVLQDGDLAEAIRASMSLPGVFSPLYLDEYCFMDGGLRYNMAINVAHKMGYDIIIAIDISEPVLNNPEGFTADPAAAIINTIGIAQYTVTEQLKDYANIIITPDVKGYGILDFQKSQLIYDEGKKAIEKYKEPLKKIRQMIYPEDYDSFGNRKSEVVNEKKESVYDSYSYLVPVLIDIEGAYAQDVGYINQCFKRLQNKPFSSVTFEKFMNEINRIGNYKSVRPRIIHKAGNIVLKLQLIQEEPKELRILAGTDFETMITTTKSFSMNLDLDAQLRGFTGIGSLISIHGTFLTDFGLEFYFMQPINPNVFFDTKVSYLEDRYNRIGDDIKDYSLNTNFSTFGASFNLGFKTLAGNNCKIGSFYKFINNSVVAYYNDPFYSIFNYYSVILDNYFNNRRIFRQYMGVNFDFNISHIDSPVFSTEGFVLNSETRFITPLSSNIKSVWTPLLTEKLIIKGAFPIGDKFSLSMQGLLGTEFLGNFLVNYPLLSEEGFNSYDRVFFPSITMKNRFGSHLAASAISLQFKPFNHLTIVGGDLFFRLDGTFGVLNYDWTSSFSQFSNPNTVFPVIWSGTFGIGIKIKASFCAYLRVGVCSNYEKQLSPLFCIDIGSFYF